ncbi:MAG: glutamyl-Q tRNA(Asp) synthetase [Oleiphilaceae bacterium]|jgi:glutamyl-Q tRNA(Asp) synthetase
MSTYRGRFAPSPTGPLHFGSLFAAVISYLEAHSHNGEWLVRIEDIDSLREQKSASNNIIETLNSHCLFSDASIIYQSTRSNLYQQTIEHLQSDKLAYVCPCSRNYLRQYNGVHKSACINQILKTAEFAIKFRTDQTHEEQNIFMWNDDFQGNQIRNLTEDFVLKRKEGFYAYQLAVVCDDIAQDISHVVRGYDLLESTPMQLALYYALNEVPPTFAHFPVIAFKNGQKLSKQNKAPAIDNKLALENLLAVFSLLGLKLKHKPDNCKHALNEALENWDSKFLYRKSELIRDSHL